VEKITNLKRVIRERLNKKGIVDLSEFKLKAINMEADTKKIETSLAKNLIKIGGRLIDSVMSQEIDLDEKIKKINDLIVGDIKVNIQVSTNPNPKRLVKAFNKGKEINDIYLDITVEEGETKEFTHSSIYFEPTKKQEGIFHFRDTYGVHIPYISFKKIVGTIYFYNRLREYIRKNKDMSTMIMLKHIQEAGIYKDASHKEEIEKMVIEYNLPVSKYVYVYLDTERKAFKEYYDYLNWTENNYFRLESIFSINRGMANNKYLLYSIRIPKLTAYYFNYLYGLNIEEEYEVKEELNLSSDYAKSYETKKNIPQKVLDRMETSKFKTHFGYVEFDELTDLEKVDIIEREWMEISKKVLFPVAKDHSLRFRRLGKHKASGLYFPGAKAVCVDLGGPSSMVHEVMHMIDYTTLPSTTLSSMFNFRGIIERYRDIANRKVIALEETNSFKSQWEGKTKYNKDYYLSPKEIFARCGELYIEQILGIDSSLVKSRDNILYPKDDDFLLELVKKYYSSIIQLALEEKEEENVASSPRIITKEEVYRVLKEGQISLFDIMGVE